MVGTITCNNNIAQNSLQPNGAHLIEVDTGWSGTINNNIAYGFTTGNGIVWGGTASIMTLGNATQTGAANNTTYSSLTLSGGGGSGAIANFVVGGSGGVTAFIAENSFHDYLGGTGYTLNATVTATSGGANFTANINKISSLTATGNNSIGSPSGNEYDMHKALGGTAPYYYNTIGNYYLNVGGSPGTRDAFLAKLVGTPGSLTDQGQCKQNWNPNYTAIAVNSYIRQGYGMADPGGVTVTITPATIPSTGTVGVTYPTQNFSASGGAAPYTWSHSGNVPPGMNFNDATAVLSGAPNTTTGSPFTFTITATDSNLVSSGPKSYTITVSAGAIVITPSSLPPGTVGVAYNQTVTASGGTAPYIYTITLGTLPSPLQLNPNTGAITGVPSGPPGASSFNIKAQDNVGASNIQAYSITINPGAVGPSPPLMGQAWTG
jgi:hypothetical protein